jgi:glycosyltransferase involved in cell wall biosynthesis
MKVLVRGPALTRTGYGEHCRFVLRALRTQENLDIYLIPVNWGESNWIWEDNEERVWMDDIIKKTAIHGQQQGQYDISIQVTIPNEWQKLAPVNIGVTAGIETTRVAPVWLHKANEMDKVITISEHSKQTFINTVYEGVDQRTGQKAYLKCNKSVDVVQYPVKKFDKVDLDLNTLTKFNFLTVAQWGPRKNLENTIVWFVEEFIDNPNVGLVVKTFAKGGSLLDRTHAKKNLSKLLAKYENRQCKIYLLHGDMTDQEMHSLYTHKNIHCVVSLTHGEGFGLPLFEAAYSGLPVLATDWSGHVDFLYMPVVDKKGKEKLKAHFAKVDFTLQPVQPFAVWDGVIQQDSMWAYPQPGSYKMKLREVYKDYSRYKSQAKKLQKWILKNFKEADQYDKLNNTIREYVFDDWNVDDWYNELNNA